MRSGSMRSGPAVLLVTVGLLAAPPAAAAPAGCAGLGGSADDGVCRVVQSTPEYSVDLRFPLGFPAEQAIVDYLSQTRAGFLNVAGTPEQRGRPYELDATAESYRSARTRGVVLTLFQNVGGAHPTTWYRAFSYDVNRGRLLSFGDLFAPGADPLATIFPIVRRQLETNSGLAGAVAESDGMDPAHYQNFAVTDDAVIFFFGRGELLPSYAGETSVRLARNEMPPLQV